MGVITALEVQKRNKKRVKVYLDGVYVFSLPLDDAARLSKGQTLTDDDIAALRQGDAVAKALDSAGRFLSHRPRSTAEVRHNLVQKEVPPDVINTALDRLTAQGYLDDRAFAEFWVRERMQFKPLSTRALRFELRQKGVPDALIADVLADLDADDAAYRAAQTQVRRLRGSQPRAFRDKLMGFLARRGFSASDARRAINRLREELEGEGGYFASDDGDTEDQLED